ncbi:MAG: low molecular weight phosphotyrosine protein phosphatase [Leptospiraceae bacterium]|nr:low molecular weight phosphotyrosine protein phosphatase [Leptospiraceae bacterium]MDW7975349.1 low molecular weight protein-tyrosine-phosphatase [Leptospiraceae bacterium]
MEKKKIRVLFVCHGNICRSPAAKGTFIKLIRDKKLEEYFHVDAAGVSAYHIGESPHPNTIKAGLEMGITIQHKARQLTYKDLDDFDYIIAMDHYNYSDILKLGNNNDHQKKVFLFREFDPEVINSHHVPDVPDPYYSGYSKFVEVQKIILRTSENLLNFILERELKK